MNRGCAVLAGLVLALPLASGAQAAPARSAVGTWLSADGKAAIRITPCAAPESGMLCGAIVWLRQPRDKAGHPTTDIHNPDKRLATRPICGMPLLWHFVPNGAGHWSDGFIYNPNNGETYHAEMTARPDGTLALRGYVGIPLLGESRTWTRAGPGQQHCG